jgi:kinesin family protein 5
MSASAEPKRPAAAGSDAIKVICRFRPQRKSQVDGVVECFKLYDTGAVEFAPDIYDSKIFNFDKVFGADCTQMDIYTEVKSVVDSVMSGFNGTIMAYGQTSAGKSWTMDGASIWDVESQGVIPRIVDSLFDSIR